MLSSSVSLQVLAMTEVDKLAPKLNGIKEGTFVFVTIRDRWPKIVSKIVDHIHCRRQEFITKFGEDVDADVKAVIGELSEIRYRMMTNKPLDKLQEDGFGDEQRWNKDIEEFGKNALWYGADWLWVECYLYRRIQGAFLRTRHLTHIDPFQQQKNDSYDDHIDQIRDALLFVSSSTRDASADKRAVLTALIKQCLWGNRCDLSLSGGDKVTRQSAGEDEHLLADDIQRAVDRLLSGSPSAVSIVLDNSGPELVADLCLADWLIHSGACKSVNFHGKAFPWFVSDVTSSDFSWVIDRCDEMAAVWKKRCESGEFVFSAHPFWTSPYAFCDMQREAPDLHEQLSHDKFAIFKGDLNYRKLVGDRDWPLTTPFEDALCGFAPCPLLALRTLKAETVAGLAPDVEKRMRSQFGADKGWMVTGEFAVAQMH